MKKSMIRKKFLLYFTCFAVVPIVVFGILASIYISANEIEARKDMAVSRLENFSQEMDKLTQEVYQIGKTVSEDLKIKDSLLSVYEKENETYLTDIYRSNELLYISKYFNKNIQVYVIGENGALYKSGYLSFKIEDFRQSDWYKSIKESKELVWFDIHKQSFVVNTLAEHFAALGIPIKDTVTEEFLGVVFIELQVSTILEQYIDNQEEELYIIHPNKEMIIEEDQVKLYEQDRVLEINEDLKLYQVDEAKPDYITKTENKIKYWNKDFKEQGITKTSQYFLSYVQIPTNEWIFVSVAENRMMHQSIYIILGFSIFLMVIVMAIALIVSYYTAHSVTKPIMLLRNSVEEIKQGNFDIKIPKLTNDEIGELGEQFNVMMVNLKELMEQILEEQTKRRSYELMLLQAQINPHFLYNTLDSLQWLIRMKKTEDSLTMTVALTNYFKTGLNRGDDIISLREEIKNAKSYLTIQSLRYQSKLRYAINLQEEIADFMMPKLILQPLIENALYHGIKGKANGGIIEVRAYRSENVIYLSVIDDGMGIQADKLKYLVKTIEDITNTRNESYGLKNVNERLKLFFKERYSFTIESIPKIGTSFVIQIKESKDV